MNKATISDRDLFDALRKDGHPLEECRRVVNERNAWLEFYRKMRDDFAQAALQGLVSRTACTTPEYFAATAYELADAMLAERAKITKP